MVAPPLILTKTVPKSHQTRRKCNLAELYENGSFIHKYFGQKLVEISFFVTCSIPRMNLFEYYIPVPEENIVDNSIQRLNGACIPYLYPMLGIWGQHLHGKIWHFSNMINNLLAVVTLLYNPVSMVCIRL